MNAQEHKAPLSTVALFGITVALLALLAPLMGVLALAAAALVLIRGEVGPGIGIGLLATVCILVGIAINN